MEITIETLDDKFKAAVTVAHGMTKLIMTVINGPDFKDASEDTQESLRGMLVDLKNFTQKTPHHDWTNEQKQIVIDTAASMSETLLSGVYGIDLPKE